MHMSRKRTLTLHTQVLYLLTYENWYSCNVVHSFCAEIEWMVKLELQTWDQLSCQKWKFFLDVSAKVTPKSCVFFRDGRFLTAPFWVFSIKKRKHKVPLWFWPQGLQHVSQFPTGLDVWKASAISRPLTTQQFWTWTPQCLTWQLCRNTIPLLKQYLSTCVMHGCEEIKQTNIWWICRLIFSLTCRSGAITRH